MNDTIHIHDIGLTMTGAARHEVPGALLYPDTDRVWLGSKGTQSGPAVRVQIERWWDDGCTLTNGVVIAPKYVYMCRLSCRSVSVESECHATWEDAYEEAYHSANRQAPVLYGEVCALIYAGIKRREAEAASKRETADDEGGI